MSIKFSNQSVGVKVTTVHAKNSKSKNSETETSKGSWEFFKHINGMVTEYLNKQINIPSTAITPAFVLATKDIFSNILIGIQVFKQLKERLGLIAEVIHGDVKTSTKYKKDEYVKKTLENRLRRW